MAAKKKPLPDLLIESQYAHRETQILFIEINDLELVTYRRQLKRYGMPNISAISNGERIEDQVKEKFFNVIAIEIPNTLRSRESLNLLSELRALGFRGVAVMMAERATMELVYRCARLGASEFLLKTRHLDVGKEISRLLAKRPSLDRSLWHPKMNLGLGLFTSAGLTPCELEMVAEFAKGFPKHSEIAKQLEKSEPYVRKNFSRIYNKLSHAIAVENSAQLAHLITVCSLYT